MRPYTLATRSLPELARFLGVNENVPNLEFSGITSSTKLLQQGDLFVALPGSKYHGASFFEEAIKTGAVGAVTDRAGAEIIGETLPTIVVDNPRDIVGDIAAWLNRSPFRSLFSVGITGTNGKTTTASLLNQMWSTSNRETGFIGTTGVLVGHEAFPTQFTTPEAPELQSAVAVMVERACKYLVMEVSSHALAQKRMRGSFFNTVAFTNLTQDHLDFHGNMESYFEAKAKLFTFEYADFGFINIDDPYGVKLSELTEIPHATISRTSKRAHWHYDNIHQSSGGYEVAIRGEGGILIEGHVGLVGAHNLDNVLMAVALAVKSGVDPLEISSNLHKLQGPSGRLEKVDIGQKFLALVDYAHTPDAVERVLAAVREITPGKVIGVLGCGGDRDATKRPIMGAALLAGTDFAVFTSDNPRSEDPQTILNQMTSGLNMEQAGVVEVDRRGAIAIAVTEAQPGDTVILLGKGHEVGQEIHLVKYPFDDRIELARAIESLS